MIYKQVDSIAANDLIINLIIKYLATNSKTLN